MPLAPAPHSISALASDLDVALSLIYHQKNLNLDVLDSGVYGNRHDTTQRWASFTYKHHLPPSGNAQPGIPTPRRPSVTNLRTLNRDAISRDLDYALDILSSQETVEVSIRDLARDMRVNTPRGAMKVWCRFFLTHSSWFARVPKCIVDTGYTRSPPARRQVQSAGSSMEVDAEGMTDEALMDKIYDAYETFAAQLEACVNCADDLRLRRPDGVEPGPAELMADDLRMAYTGCGRKMERIDEL